MRADSPRLVEGTVLVRLTTRLFVRPLHAHSVDLRALFLCLHEGRGQRCEDCEETHGRDDWSVLQRLIHTGKEGARGISMVHSIPLLGGNNSFPNPRTRGKRRPAKRLLAPYYLSDNGFI